jgi:4-hydroxy-tetrahydrodipicolinate synthase
MTLRGVFTALVTPFKDDGSLDEAAFKALLERQVAAGCGLVPVGTTGEAPTVTPDEQLQLLRWCVEAGGERPIVAGIGSNSTAKAIEAGKKAQDAGATHVLATAPYYNKPTQAGLFAHFAAIAEALDVPVVVYDVPGRSAVAVATETTAKLAQVEGIAAVKDATADLAKGAEVARVAPNLALLSGDDFTTVPLISTGGDGCISVASNLMPERMVAMVDAALAGDFATASAESIALQPLFRALFVQTNPLPIKTALAAKGLCGETFRLPLVPMDDGPKAQILAAAREAGAL